MSSKDHQFPCPQCGADLRFAPAEGKLMCDHCGYEQPVEAPPPPPPSAPASGPAALARFPSTRTTPAGGGPTGAGDGALTEHPYQAALANALPPGAMEEAQTVTCTSCGATFEFDPDTHAAECPFCASPVVADSASHRQIKPQAVVPFTVDERTARRAMTDWLGRLWFAPNGLVEYARKGRALNGIYVPYWTFDADTASAYTGQRGEVYYETRTVVVNVNGQNQTRQEQVRRVAWYPAAGQVARRFDDVLVMAAQSLPRGYVDALEPWSLNDLTAYRPAYLAGFRAEGYTVGLEEGHAIAREKMDAVIAEDVRQDIGGDEQRIDHIETRASDETFKHVLLPVWTAAYKYRGKSYRFVINGQTGKVQGERPWSFWKIAFAVLAALIVVGVVVYLKR